MTVTYREPRSPDTPLYLPSNMATMLNELKPENQSFNDYGIELMMFAIETVTKANEISSRQETMRSMLDKITEKFYDTIDITRLIEAACAIGFPAICLWLGLQMHMAPRVI